MAVNYRALLPLLLAAALVSRLLPLALPSFTDPDHYYHLRIVESVLQQQTLPAFDPLSYQGRPQTYYPLFHLMAASVSLLTGLDAYGAYAAFSLLVFASSVLAVFAVARRLLGTDAGAFYASLFYAFLPAALIRTLAFTRPDAFSLFLLPLLLLFLLERRRWALALLAASLVLLHPYTGIMACGLLALWWLYSWKESGKADLKLLLAFGVGAALASIYYLHFPLRELSLARTVSTSSELQPFQLDFALSALGITWAFLFVALLERRQLKLQRPAFFAAWLAGALALTLAAPRNALLLALPCSVLAAAGLEAARKRLAHLFPVLLALLGLSLSFLFISQLVDAQGQYTSAAVRSAQTLSAFPSGTVVSAWDRGHLLSYAAQKQVFMDGYFEFAPSLDLRQQDSLALFYSPSVSLVEKLRAEDVRYVYADSRFPFPRVPWTQFAAENPGISRVLDSNDTVIWQTN